MAITEMRRAYHERLCREIIRSKNGGKNGAYFNMADTSSKPSIAIANKLVEYLGFPIGVGTLAGQTVGNRFEKETKDFIQAVFDKLQHARPGEWMYSMEDTAISYFDQYSHLSNLKQITEQHPELASILGGDYLITPDIVISRTPLTDEEININEALVDAAPEYARKTVLRKSNLNEEVRLLHASISCKWSLRSDRAQNTRSEALNLIRNRKGRVPHALSVTMEPLPSRVVSLALGTGDLDCVYHAALPELIKAVGEVATQEQQELLGQMVDGRRLRDISDLPFDIAV